MIFGAFTLIGMAATIFVQGGWQAVAAAFAIFNGGGFALTVAALRAAGERPRSRYPSWAHATARPGHGLAPTPSPRPAALAAPTRSRPATRAGQPLAPRPARTV